MTNYSLNQMRHVFLAIVIVAALMTIATPSAASPTPTPESGFRIHGSVRLAYEDGPTMSGVAIRDGESLAATTNGQGNYASNFQHLSNEERIIIYAELPGYTLDPQQVEWEQDSHALTDRVINFVARPLAITCSTPPYLPTRLLVSQSDYRTTRSTAYFYVEAGSGPTKDIPAIVSFVGLAGTVSQKAALSIYTVVTIEVPLAPLTANNFTVYGQFEYGTGCTYITSTEYDRFGHRLGITQEGPVPTTTATVSSSTVMKMKLSGR